MVGKENPLTVEISILVWFLADNVNRQQNDLICTFNVTGFSELPKLFVYL